MLRSETEAEGRAWRRHLEAAVQATAAAALPDVNANSEQQNGLVIGTDAPPQLSSIQTRRDEETTRGILDDPTSCSRLEVTRSWGGESVFQDTPTHAVRLQRMLLIGCCVMGCDETNVALCALLGITLVDSSTCIVYICRRL